MNIHIETSHEGKHEDSYLVTPAVVVKLFGSFWRILSLVFRTERLRQSEKYGKWVQTFLLGIGGHNIIKSGDQYCLLIIAVVTHIFVVNSIDFRDLVVGSTTCYLLFLDSVRSRSLWPAATPASPTLWRTSASGHLLTKMVQAAQDPASHSDLQLPSLVIPGERRKAVKVQLLEAPQPTLPRGGRGTAQL